MSFKEYQSNSVRSKSFSLSRSSPLISNRRPENMMIVPYKPQVQLRHASESFLDPKLNLSPRRQKIPKPHPQRDSFVCYSPGKSSPSSQTLFEGYQESDLDSNDSEGSSDSGRLSEDSNASQSSLRRKKNLEYDSFTQVERPKTIRVQSCLFKPSSQNSFCSLFSSLVVRLLILVLVLPVVFAICVHLFVAPLPYVCCVINRGEMVEKLRSAELFMLVRSQVAGQDDLIGQVLKTLSEFLNEESENVEMEIAGVTRQNTLLVVFIYGSAGVGKTHTVQTILRHLQIHPSCHTTLSHHLNVSLPAFGFSVTLMDSVDRLLNDSLQLSQHSEEFSLFRDKARVYFPSSISSYLYSKHVVFITSWEPPDENYFTQLIQSDDLNSVKKFERLKVIEARSLNKSDVSKCVEIELKRRYSQIELNEAALKQYVSVVLKNLQFDKNGNSVYGCKTVSKLLSLFMSE